MSRDGAPRTILFAAMGSAVLARVPVPMMQVGIMRVLVAQGRMVVPVRVWLAGRVVRAMCVLVVLVVDVAMLMIHRFVQMLVLMPL